MLYKDSGEVNRRANRSAQKISLSNSFSLIRNTGIAPFTIYKFSPSPGIPTKKINLLNSANQYFPINK
ncbi:hypothetical protein BMETH_313_2 [methanotrophic bacterial endosymbiont of Bathymodiolus sp.]|nr:hypothetical protein BMETH_313_2 [methanotrophic bacterial endosymbiont of Bathymodiolus sp.]